MNLLILSVGRRCELVDNFKKQLNQINRKVIAIDMTDLAPALYFADKKYIIKKNFNRLHGYINDVISVCKSKNVSYVLSLVDPELELLSDYKETFDKHNITLILSDKKIINHTQDKFKFYTTFKDTIRLAKTYNNYHDCIKALKSGILSFPIIVKKVKGSASIGLAKIESYENLAFHENKSNCIFQEFIDGTEYGIDLFFDLITGKPVSVFMKEKLKMRAGETDKALSVLSDDLLQEILKLSQFKGFRGPIDLDIFISNSGEIILNEINARFGGGYPLAYHCGVDFIKLIINNMENKINKPEFGEYKLDQIMMKYNSFFFKEKG
ncbi:ATP-grasp domain-containing protein [bacterium]|jgi:carbamoyl-phosphate synthase large subunit|nr:ATP-grasp domain-containing protein [bacterium]